MITPVASPELFNTISKYSNQKKLIVKRLKEFILHKLKYPTNGSIPGQFPGFGSNDKKFKTTGNFGRETRGIAHAHLTHNISIVYLVDGDKLNLYGVYTHDAIGTGNPPDINRQQQVSSQWANMTLDQTIDPASMDDGESGEEPTPSADKKPAAKVDYTPKSKPIPTPTAKLADPKLELAKQVDKEYTARGLYNRLSRAENKNAALAVLNSELKYLEGIVRRGQPIYPNVVRYIKGVEQIFKLYTSA